MKKSGKLSRFNEKQKEKQEKAEGLSRLQRGFVLFSFCLSGAAALIYEVSWTRLLTLVLGSTVYAVSTMLSTFMAGLALGGYIGGAAGDKSRNPLFVFGSVQMLIGASGLFTLFLLNVLPPVYATLYNHFHLSLSLYFLFQFLLCALFMLVPTTLMGATFPLLSKVMARELNALGKNIGGLYTVNNAGAILGSFSAGFFLIPLLGMRKTIFIASVLNFLAGSIVLFFRKSSSVEKKFVLPMLLVFVLFAILPSHDNASSFLFNVYHAGRYKSYGEFQNEVKSYRLVFEKEDPHGLIRIFYDPAMKTYYLQNGGKIEGSTGDDVSTQILLAGLPLATASRAEDFLGIGLGTGMTAYEAAKRVKHVDWAEINAAVVEASQKIFYPKLHKKINLIMDDGRHFLQQTEKKYDVISSEPSYPTEGMTANLFTYEFYRMASTRLKPGGVFCQWVPYFILTTDDMDILLHTFTSVFPHAFVWQVTETGDYLFVGSRTEILRDESAILSRLRSAGVKFSPKRIYTSQQVMKISRDMKRRNILVNTDDRPIFEFSVARNLILGSDNLK